MHVLLLPKWYPGRNDPQLGDFIRKQALAAGAFVRMSVLHVEGVRGLPVGSEEELQESATAWELVVRYRANDHGFTPWRKAVNLIRFWRASQRGWERVRVERGKPDLLHAYILIRPALVAWWLSQKNGVPYVVAEQSSEYMDGTFARKDLFTRAITRFLCKRSVKVLAVSKHLGEALKDHGVCERYTVVPNVIPGLERPLPVPGQPGRFLMVADLVDRIKNVSGALRALADARKTDGRLNLTIIGDGPDRRQLEQIVHHLGLVSHVQFLGRLPNTLVLDHMASAFAVLVNSRVETFSVVTGEALAQGKPVIATRCGGPEAFITPENGLLIAPGDDAALAAAMLAVTREAVNWDPEAIRRTVGDRFGPTAVGRALRDAYRSALA